MALQQLGGVNGVLFYASEVFVSAGNDQSEKGKKKETFHTQALHYTSAHAMMHRSVRFLVGKHGNSGHGGSAGSDGRTRGASDGQGWKEATVDGNALTTNSFLKLGSEQ
jgi:hypothetical protein